MSKKGNNFNLEYFATNLLHSEVADSDPYDCLIYRETLKELFDIVKEEANIYEDCLATSKWKNNTLKLIVVSKRYIWWETIYLNDEEWQ